VRRLILLLSIALLLTSCIGGAGGRIVALPPEEVLRNAAHASLNFDSARFKTETDIKIEGPAFSMDGNVDLDGIMTDGGDQIQFTSTTDAEVFLDGVKASVQGKLEIILSAEGETYLFLHELTANPALGLLAPNRVSKFKNIWWLLPRDDVNADAQVSPDPRLLHSQAKVISVKRNLGFVKVNGRDAYFYKVEIDPEKLVTFLAELARENGEEFDEVKALEDAQKLDADGELVIDATDFTVQRFKWNIRELSLSEGTLFSGTVNATISDYNANLTITPPAEPLLFSPAVFIGIPPVRGVLPTDESILSPDEQEELMQQLLDTGEFLPRN
jgi:hypothetical protein